MLLTAISKPKRVLEFLPKDTIMEAFEDHHNFTSDEINRLKEKYKEYTFITTSKDFVKLKEFNFNDLYLMELDIVFDNTSKIVKIDDFLSSNN